MACLWRCSRSSYGPACAARRASRPPWKRLKSGENPMARMSPLMIAPLVVFAAVAGLALVGLQREDPNALPSALAGRQAPAVAVTSLGDKPDFADDDLRSGEVSLVNYWASWCAPCRVEHPNLEQLADQGVTIYGVNYKDKPANALKFLNDLGNPYAAMGVDAAGRMALDWG